MRSGALPIGDAVALIIEACARLEARVCELEARREAAIALELTIAGCLSHAFGAGKRTYAGQA